MNVAEILKHVEKFRSNVNYWFVRTDYGEHFEDFINGGYIAVGWDYLSLYEIKNAREEAIKKKIASAEKIDIGKPQGKRKVTSTYNKLKALISLKKDDIVVIPSRNSDRLAFGQIIDNEAYQDFDAKTFTKRRKVKWLEIKYMNDLNPVFYKVKSNQHTISNINSFAPYVDRVTGSLFKKGDNTHFVLKIEQQKDINFEDLKKLMDSINILIKNINRELVFNENLDEFYIKINLQSKGALELIKNGRSLAVLAFILFSASCNNLNKVEDKELKKLIEDNRRTIDTTNNVIDTLKVNLSALSKPFIDGH